MGDYPSRCTHGDVTFPVDLNTQKVQGVRCQKEAEVYLYTPDKDRQFAYCLQHALECSEEYYIKLGEDWTIKPIDGDYELSFARAGEEI